MLWGFIKSIYLWFCWKIFGNLQIQKINNNLHLLLANLVFHLPAGMIKKGDSGDCYWNKDTSSDKKTEPTDPSHLQHKITLGSEKPLSLLLVIDNMNESQIEEIILASFLQKRKHITEEQNPDCELGHDFRSNLILYTMFKCSNCSSHYFCTGDTRHLCRSALGI